MKNYKNLKILTRNASSKILEARCFIELLDDMAEGEKKSCLLISHTLSNLKSAFNDIEECRKMISFNN